jgi:hypothetical protein
VIIAFELQIIGSHFGQMSHKCEEKIGYINLPHNLLSDVFSVLIDKGKVGMYGIC